MRNQQRRLDESIREFDTRHNHPYGHNLDTVIRSLWTQPVNIMGTVRSSEMKRVAQDSRSEMLAKVYDAFGAVDKDVLMAIGKARKRELQEAPWTREDNAALVHAIGTDSRGRV